MYVVCMLHKPNNTLENHIENQYLHSKVTNDTRSSNMIFIIIGTIVNNITDPLFLSIMNNKQKMRLKQ